MKNTLLFAHSQNINSRKGDGITNIMCAINFAGCYKQDVYVNRYGYTSAQAAQIHDRIKLAHELPDRRGFVEENWAKTIDEQWDAHHAKDFIVSDTIGDYQVFRIFDIEIDYCEDYTERMNEDELARLKEIESKYEDDSDEYDNAIQELDTNVINRLYEEEGSANFYLDEVGEYAQLWWNVKTQEKYWLAKICQDFPHYCDFSMEWELLDGTTKNKQKFANRFAKIPDSHYIDLSVHADLQAVGYTGIDASDWWYGCGEDENESEEFKYFKNVVDNEEWVDFLGGLVTGHSEYDTDIKAYGIHAMMKTKGMDDEYKKQYLAATKIARRNKYNIVNQSLWDKLIDIYIQMGKDIHSPHYVCPEDLSQEYIRYEKLYQRMKDKIAEREYKNNFGKYLDIKISSKHLNIFVCPSVADMKEEGKEMNHCVYRCGYYNPEKNCIILLVRDKSGNRISTVELKTNSWTIAQNRGVNNSIPRYYDEAKECIMNNIDLFRNASKDKVQIISMTHITTQVA